MAFCTKRLLKLSFWGSGVWVSWTQSSDYFGDEPVTLCINTSATELHWHHVIDVDMTTTTTCS